ncbi:MAG TPA: Na+/H+ antiporter NhaA [Dehalococcoidia bacterium]|nr:Na+/H+ antiporter NhaA [Dehalococcoidia bacterium]
MSRQERTRGILRRRAATSMVSRRFTLPAQRFIQTETVSGLVLLLAALAGIVWVNSPWSDSYHDLWAITLTMDLHVVDLTEDLRHWVNDALMVFFFLVAGMEIKRELVHGELSDRRQAILPATAALGGMALPALIFLAFNAGHAGQDGWGIPMATDTAFALGVLAFAAPRIPPEVRVFLLALAIFDDIGALVIIAIFYAGDLSFEAIGVAAALLALIILMRQMGVVSLAPYLVVGFAVWAAFLESGIHPTIAGVILGLLTPATARLPKEDFLRHADSLNDDFRQALAREDEGRADYALGEMEELVVSTEPPTERLQRLLHAPTSFVIVPLFALANSGLDFSGSALQDSLASRIALGIFVGLLVGKFFGIVSFTWISVRLGLGALPGRMHWRHVAGAALLAGIGFTVSLFVAGLAFDEESLQAEARMGIFAACLAAGIIGAIALRLLSRSDSDAIEVSAD